MPFSAAYECNSIHRFLPVMICRLMLSLRKAADPSKATWSLESITNHSSRERPASEQPHNIPLAPRSDWDTV